MIFETGPEIDPVSPTLLFEILTGAPFQVTDDTVVGAASTVSVVVALTSPTRLNVEDVIVALRTRYGPATITEGTSGATSYDDATVRGCQKVEAVNLSVTITTVLPNLTTEIPDGLPVIITVLLDDLALMDIAPDTMGVPWSLGTTTASTL